MANKYGNDGNRWWVGENLTNQNSFRTSNFFSNNAPSGYQSFPSGDAADDAKLAATPKGKTVNLHNIDWLIMGGPYPTQAAANAAISGIQSKSPAPGAVQQAVSGISGLQGIAKILGDIGIIISSLFNPAMWISVGWLVLGFLLLIAGVIWWNKGGIAKAAETAAFL